MQVDIFYRSQKTDVYVAKSKTSLLLGPTWPHADVRRADVRKVCATHSDWKVSRAGVAVLVYETKESLLTLILAEVGSGFTLWKNRISSFSDYTVGGAWGEVWVEGGFEEGGFEKEGGSLTEGGRGFGEGGSLTEGGRGFGEEGLREGGGFDEGGLE